MQPQKHPDSDTESRLAYHQDLLELQLKELLEQSEMPASIREGLNYVLFPGGKRIRPRLCMALCEDLGAGVHKVVRAAAAIEIMHTASLLHDDLPCLDNDDFRRNKPSCHKMFGEGMALLLGDYMIPWSLSALQSRGTDQDLDAEINKILCQAFMHVCSGQVLDLEAHHTTEELLSLHRLKTGALFSAALRIAALVSTHDQALLDKCTEFGLQVGIGFQMLDDYIDAFGSDSQRGRPGSSDQRNQKTTFFQGNSQDDGMHFLQQRSKAIVSSLNNLQGEGRECALTAELISQLFGSVVKL